MNTATIIVYSHADCETALVHCPRPISTGEVWMYVLRQISDLPDLQLDEVDGVIADMGDDIMDINIVAVIPGFHECIHDSLTFTPIGG